MDKMKNLVVGLTGQTGAGKTTVSDYLKENGVTIIDADHIAREVVESGSACIADIALEFGCEYINMDGTLNRKKMAKTVFTDKAKLKKLNALIFPYIIDSIRTRTAQLRREQQGIIVLDAPTLFESGADRECDYVVSITAPRQLRRERIIRRDRLTEEERAWLDAIPTGASANNAYELKLLRIQQRHIMEKIAEYEKCSPEELFTATITDMRKPGPDAEGKTADSAVQKMAMVNKDSAFVRVTQLREALNKVSGRIISLTTQIRQQEEFEKRYALELARLDIAKMRATGEVDVDPEGDEEDEEEAPHDKDSGAVS